MAVVPGSAFGQFGVGHVRVCYTAPIDVLQEALVRIRRYVEHHRTAAK